MLTWFGYISSKIWNLRWSRRSGKSVTPTCEVKYMGHRGGHASEQGNVTEDEPHHPPPPRKRAKKYQL